jgi:Domain of unknown function (DUF4272)
MDSSHSSLKRKERTERYLKALGVPVNPHLPRIEDDTDARLREPREVARRAIILYVLVLVAHKVFGESAAERLKEEGLWESVSPKEKEFFESDNPPQQDILNATWRAESLWALLWALGKVEKLELPTEICNSQLIQEIMSFRESLHIDFVNTSTLRPLSEILDEVDLIYRTDWAMVEARINDQEPPNGFLQGVVYERHYALNWLTWYADEWDDVTTDT